MIQINLQDRHGDGAEQEVGQGSDDDDAWEMMSSGKHKILYRQGHVW